MKLKLTQKEAVLIYEELEFMEHFGKISRELLKLKGEINPVYRDEETRAEWTYWGRYGYRYRTEIEIDAGTLEYLKKLLTNIIQKKLNHYIPFSPDLSHLKKIKEETAELDKRKKIAERLLRKLL